MYFADEGMRKIWDADGLGLADGHCRIGIDADGWPEFGGME